MTNDSFSRILRPARPRRRWPGCLKNPCSLRVLFFPFFINIVLVFPLECSLRTSSIEAKVSFSRLTTQIQNCESCAFVWCLHPRTNSLILVFHHFVIDWFPLFVSTPASLANEVFHLSLVLFLPRFFPSLIVVCVYILGRCAVSHLTTSTRRCNRFFLIVKSTTYLKSSIMIDPLFTLMFHESERVCDYKGVVCA